MSKFQFHKGTIKAKLQPTTQPFPLYFNSIKVQLKQEETLTLKWASIISIP